MTALRAIRIGTRGSALARIQAETVAEALRAAHPRREFVLVEVSTHGDRDPTSPLSRIGGIGVFVKEIEAALREERIDMAVHSLKDMPTESPPDLIIAAVPQRGDARDALVSRDGLTLDRLPARAKVGTGSSRRAAQVRSLRPDLQVAGIRGNVDTRLRKVEGGEYDAAVLAMAGLTRLGLQGRAAEVFSTDIIVPAPGQGALAVQVRAEDVDALTLAMPLDDPDTHRAVRAERAVLAALGAGCLLPVGAYGQVAGNELRLRGLVVHPSGSPSLREATSGDARHPEQTGRELARRLIDSGARAIIEAAGTER